MQHLGQSKAMKTLSLVFDSDRIKKGKCVTHQYCGVINPKILNISPKTLATIKRG